jgi:carbon-monoxide dehydrogenase iron sulfur subunit
MRIVRDPAVCDGCRNCELACSFHHKQVFGPEFSSVKVANDCQEGETQWTVDATCDLCRDEKHPLCIQYCFGGALRRVEDRNDG